MAKIVVSYFEAMTDAKGNHSEVRRGQETIEDIEEALIPTSAQHKIFCVKKFSGTDNYRWFVDSVQLISANAAFEAEYKVVLSKIKLNTAEEFLTQTLKKNCSPVNRLLWQGSLVEVDYGFIQSVGRHDGQIKTNKRYSDTLQQGEMHKRRLAVVINVSNGRVKVAPVTSDPQSAGDKTSFEISAATLSPLHFYSSSGKRSWVLCSMVETVSVRRILPPISTYNQRGGTRLGRNTKYPFKLDNEEQKLLKESMLHAIGVTDYSTLKDELDSKIAECQEIDLFKKKLADFEIKFEEIKRENLRLTRVEEIARSWESKVGKGELDRQVTELGEMYREIEVGLPGG